MNYITQFVEQIFLKVPHTHYVVQNELTKQWNATLAWGQRWNPILLNPTFQVQYSLLSVERESGVAEVCQELGIRFSPETHRLNHRYTIGLSAAKSPGLVAYSPLCLGLLAGRYKAWTFRSFQMSPEDDGSDISLIYLSGLKPHSSNMKQFQLWYQKATTTYQGFSRYIIHERHAVIVSALKTHRLTFARLLGFAKPCSGPWKMMKWCVSQVL